MKKVLVVLLIAVLAIGAVSADASLTGKLKSTVKYNLDSETINLSQSASFTAGFAFNLFDETGAKKGENYPYAEIEAKLSIGLDDFSFDTSEAGYWRVAATNYFWGTGDISSLVSSSSPKALSTTMSAIETEDNVTTSTKFYRYDVRDLKFGWTSLDDILTKAVIVGENWSLNLLENAGAGNYATNAVADKYTYVASKKVYKQVAFDLDNSTDDDNGITFTYDGHSLSVNQFYLDETYYGDEDYTKDDLAIAYESKDLVLADCVTAKAAASYIVSGDVYSGNLSAKASYETEDLSAAVAGDVQVAFAEETTADYDVAVDAAYLEDAVVFDFYFASEATAASPYKKWVNINKALYDLSFTYDYVTTSTLYANGLNNINVGGYLTYKNSGDAIAITSPISNKSITNLMSGKVAVNVAKFAELGEVSALSVTLEGHDMLNEENSASVNKHAFNAEVSAAAENFGVSGKFGAKKFTVEDSRSFYAEVVADFAKFAELPVNSLVLTIGSTDLDMDANNPSTNPSTNNDCLYIDVTSAINDVLTVGLTGNYLAGKERTDVIGVNATFTGVENLTVSAGVDHQFADLDNNETNVEVSAEYAGDLFTVNGLVQAYLVADDEANCSFGAYVGAESTKLVDGATIGLAYSKLDASGNVTTDYTDSKFGFVAATCTLAF